MATVVNPFGEEYEASRVLVQRTVTMLIEAVVDLDDDSPEPWTEDEDISEEVNDQVSRALRYARAAVPHFQIEVYSTDDQTVEAVDG